MLGGLADASLADHRAGSGREHHVDQRDLGQTLGYQQPRSDDPEGIHRSIAHHLFSDTVIVTRVGAVVILAGVISHYVLDATTKKSLPLLVA